jgi:acyl-coenzyme A synthetase/AMP-(fatty) acid ligase
MSGTKGRTPFRTLATSKGALRRLIDPFVLFLVVLRKSEFNQIHQRLTSRPMAICGDEVSREIRFVDVIPRTSDGKVCSVISLSVASREKLVRDE